MAKRINAPGRLVAVNLPDGRYDLEQHMAVRPGDEISTIWDSTGKVWGLVRNLKPGKSLRRGVDFVALVAAGTLAACTPMDKAERDVRNNLPLCDPGSLQIRNIHPSEEFTTGEINARTVSGGFAGFVPVVIDNRKHVVNVGAINWPALCDNGGNTLEADLAMANAVEENAK